MHRRRPKNKESLIIVIGIVYTSHPPPPTPVANTGKASTCQTMKRKERREAAVMAVSADGGRRGKMMESVPATARKRDLLELF